MSVYMCVKGNLHGMYQIVQLTLVRQSAARLCMASSRRCVHRSVVESTVTCQRHWV